MATKGVDRVDHTRKRLGGRPSLEVSAAMADTILDLTWALFLSDGYKKLSIDKIAREGGISKRTIYARFGSKVDLLVASFERGARNATAELEADLHARGDKGRLKDFVLRMLDMLGGEDYLAMNGMVALEGRTFPQLLEMQRRIHSEVLANFSSLLGTVIPRYPLGQSGVLLARSLLALLDGWARSISSPEVIQSDTSIRTRIYQEARELLTLHGCDLSTVP